MTSSGENLHGDGGAGGGVDPFPWSWFDFSADARLLRGMPAPVDRGGAELVWRVCVAGREVPFKILRRDGVGRRLLVLLHGMGLTIASFRGIAPYLFATHDLALLDYSSLTHGMRPGVRARRLEGLGIHGLTRAVWPVADVLGASLIDLAGSSLGGGMCLVAALDEPKRVRRIVLSNPACFPQCLPRAYRLARIPLIGEMLMATTRAERLVAGVEQIGYVDPRRFVPELRQRYVRIMSGVRNRMKLMDLIRALPADERDLTAAGHVSRLRYIAQPVLVTWGEQDPLLVAGAGERLARMLPRGIYAGYPDLAHLPHEEAPERIGRSWAAFLG